MKEDDTDNINEIWKLANKLKPKEKKKKIKEQISLLVITKKFKR